MKTLNQEEQELVARYLPNLADHDYSKWLTDGCYLDPVAAAKVVEFFEEELVQTMGKFAGQHVQLLQWQIYKFIVPVFGIKKPDGKRRFRRAYVRIPRKNGKSTLASGLILYLLACDNEARPLVYGYAVNGKQARIVLKEAIAYVEKSAYLNDEIFITYKDKIECRTSDGVYEVLSKDSKDKDGLNAHGAVCDEMHQLPDGVIVDRVHRSTSTRDQPLEIFITTSGTYSPGKETICWEYDQEAIKTDKDPSYEPTLYPLIYGAEEDDDIYDPAVWFKCNPSLGDVKSLEYMQGEARKAQRNSAAKQDFKRFELNIWVGTKSSWIKDEDWQARVRNFTEKDMLGRPCFAGLDLSKTRDYTALVLCFTPWELDQTYTLLPYLWIPEQTLEERKEKQPKILEWLEQGWIIKTEGDVVDYDQILDKVNYVRDLFKVNEIAFDDWNSSMLVQYLQKKKAPMVEFRQGFRSFSGPCKDFDIQMGQKGKIWHNGNPAMAWMLGNVVMTKDAALNWKPDKDASADAIDGIVAAIMAFGRAFGGWKVNPLEERGLRSLND